MCLLNALFNYNSKYKSFFVLFGYKMFNWKKYFSGSGLVSISVQKVEDLCDNKYVSVN